MQSIEEQLHALLQDIAPSVYNKEEESKIIAHASSLYNSLFKNDSGSNNIGIGNNTLLKNTSGSDNIAIGNSCDNQNFNNTICIGNNTIANADNQVILGDTLQTVYVQNTIQVVSDERKKYDVTDTSLGLDFINNLRPVDYKLKEEKDPIVHHGLIAQELDKLVKDMKYNFGGLQNNNDNYTIGYTELIAPLIKSVQELFEQNKKLYFNNIKLEKRINNLEKNNYSDI